MTPPQRIDTTTAAKTRPSSGNGRKKPGTSTKKRAAGPVPIDWEAGHGTVSGTLAMAANAAGAAAFGTALGVPATWPLAVAAAGAVGHGLIAPLRRGATGATIGARLSGWAIAGAWSAGVIASDPRHWTGSGFGWAAGTLAAGSMLVYGLADEAELQEEARDEDARSAEKRQAHTARWAIANEWVDRIEQVTHVRVTPVALAMRPDGTGFALEVALPASITAARLAGFNVALAEAGRLPVGCMVQVVPTITQGHVLIDVDTEDTADRIQTYGDDFAQLSVLTGIPWYLNRKSQPVPVFLREACALLLGPPGSGKTTLLDTILAGFCRCADVVTWVIDLGKKGNAARAFLNPWMESQGLIPPPPGQDRLPEGIRPGVDWVATDAKTALTMLKVAKAISEWRMLAYAELMRRADTSLLPVSPRIPFIDIVVDEGVELLNSTTTFGRRGELREELISVMETCRAMAIRLTLTSVDGNLTALQDSRIRKYANVRAALTSTDLEGAGVAKLFEGRARGIDARQLEAPGSGVAEAKTSPGRFRPQPIRTFKTSPSFARAAVAATDSWRASLEPDAVRMIAAQFGKVYEQRWARENIGWLLGETTESQTPATPTGQTGGRAGLEPLPWRHSRGKDNAGKASEAKPLSEQEEDEIAAFHAALGNLPETDEPPAQPAGQPEPIEPSARPATAPDTPIAWRGKAVQILRGAGTDTWMSVKEIRDALADGGTDLARQTVSTALADMARRHQVRTRGTGSSTAYAAPEDANL
ncbi:hypothetical protein KGQ20_27960 [Catenulispora sp. NF23]|uniref:hypothetical protein n=1 Tax=Catenulispora pinistramenti TaxID=2705254 RepID=UPI001BA4CA2A|nr:hypothetical protein [Catenulispora pinistramenti]MBS2536602.1 hypothetical protein [Catenulispora pinistramenti]